MSLGDEAAPTKAFISYAHDSAAHREEVRRLWYFLIEHGVDAWCDLGAADQRQEWPRLTEQAVEHSDYVLVIASPEYGRRANRPADYPGGRGVEYEAGLLRDRLFSHRSRWYPRILPVVLPSGSREHIPAFLGRWSGTCYVIESFSVPGAEALLRTLTRQPGELGPIPGPPPRLPHQPAPMDSRSHLLDELTARLRTLPVMQTVPARVTLTEMVNERLDVPIEIEAGLEPDAFLRDLVVALARRPGGLGSLADVVRFLHRGQPIEQSVRAVIERWELSG